ncbi:hypothetical protein [Lysobacter sp. Root983]|uniref:hypothetical protein n=1 Tax=Lysobacter sp. Root983 TaxID=1736613 RepID=UPI000710B1D4|nr:hypothetical protein [Lysobacter sp. Root983]KRD79836.1 hypothetical protein ASE43_02755 [Lysobacter sp. Root983]
MDTAPIAFPVIYRFGDDIVPCGKELIAFGDFRHVGANRYLCSEGARTDRKFRWLVDRHGQLREFQVTGYRRRWLSKLNWLWSMSLVEYELLPGRAVTVSELLGLLARSNPDSEKSSSRSFRRFLKRLDPAQVLGEADFLTYMRVPPSAIYDCYPEVPGHEV